MDAATTSPAEGTAPGTPAEGTGVTAEHWPVRPALAWFSVVVLMFATILGYLDRQILALLVGPIRASLQITDFQFSLLQGVAFGLFYAVFGLPFGWLVDRTSRRGVICVGVLLWSAATVACGMAQNFEQLAVARFAVGIGEAALLPAVYSLLADIFPARRLATAFGLFGTGATIGSALAYSGGGLMIRHFEKTDGATLPLLGHLAPWQVVFVVVGLPGLVVALLPWLVPDLRRQRAATRQVPARPPILPFLRRNPLYFFCHFVGFGLNATIAFGLAAWIPALLTRHMGLDIAQAGVLMGTLGATVGLIGYAGNGWVVDRWFAAGRRDAHLRFYAYGLLAIAAMAPLAYLSANLWLFVPFNALIFIILPFSGPAVAHLQMATPPELRGQMSAIYALTYNLMGMCLGPSAVALITDYGFHDPQMIHKSMTIMAVVTALIGSGVFWLGLKPSRRALGDMV